MKSLKDPIYMKLDEMENEIKSLKLMTILQTEQPKTVVSLQGVLKGISVDEKDFEEAESSLFKFGV